MLKVGQVKEIYEMKGAGRSIRGLLMTWASPGTRFAGI